MYLSSQSFLVGKGDDLGLLRLDEDLHQEERESARLGRAGRSLCDSKGNDRKGLVPEYFNSDATGFQFCHGMGEIGQAFAAEMWCQPPVGG